MAAGFTACSDNDDVASNPTITIADSEKSKTIEWDEVEGCIEFVAGSKWTATVDDVTSRASNTQIDWLKLTQNSGDAGTVRMPFLLSKNDDEYYRDAQIHIQCEGGQPVTINVHQNNNPAAAKTYDKTKIKDFDKFYLPNSYNEGFEKGEAGMLKSDARYSWWRMKQSDHFFVFWEPGFGDDPNGTDVPEALRVDVDDLLAKAEQFYNTNVNKLKMVTVGQGKSQLDDYKMEIYLLYQDEWLATGSGYDNVIGALWVNPSTCQPVGATIGHEIGHSFQYQVYADKLKNGEEDVSRSGWRYGFGGNGGCTYWEQCAQWQAAQDYPDDAFSYYNDVWTKEYHRHFMHEWQRYASYYWQYYITQQHGIETFGKLWQESNFPEDPIQTYTRLYMGGDYEKFYDEYYQYAIRCLTYDFDAIHAYAPQEAMNYKCTMYSQDDGSFIPAYSSVPGTTGFNFVQLQVPAVGTTVSVDLKALQPGSALSADDPGNIVDGDYNVIGNTSNYNSNSSNALGNYRFGFISVKGTDATYGEMTTGSEGKAEFTVPAGCEKLYLCVVATPTYASHAWDEDETNDDQWPYAVTFTGTNVKGYYAIDKSQPLTSVDFTVALNPEVNNDYAAINVAATDAQLGQLAQAFHLQPASIIGKLQPAGTEPAEGTVVFAAINSDGSYYYGSTANGWGHWVTADGDVTGWGDTASVFSEFQSDSFSFNVGQMPEQNTSGGKSVIRQALIYTKDGQQYVAKFTMNITFK